MAMQGSDRGYHNAHYAARRHVAGKPCCRCGARPVEAALKHDADSDRLAVAASHASLYSADPTDYVPMCVPCHRRYDGARRVAERTHCPQGHPYSPDNTSVRTDGSRRCRACHRAQERERLEDPEKLAAKRALPNRPLTEAQRRRKTELQRERRAVHGR